MSDRRTHDVSRQAIQDRVDRLELKFNSLGIDSFGVSKSHLATSAWLLAQLYERYFRVQSFGVEHVPDHGRAMLVGNHSGGVAIDGAMVLASMFLEKEPPRLAHAMADKFLNKFPISSTWTARTGQFTGLPEHAERLLQDDRLLMVFPEGAHGTAKLYSERNSLVDFGTGFVRLAQKTRSPIVPFGFIGGGEAIPTVFNSTRIGKLLGVPYVPFTPWGAALPLPVSLAVHYGEPMVFDGDGTEEDSVIQGHVDRVKEAIAALIAKGNEGRVPFLGGGES